MAEDPIATGVVENLVTQFSSALDCVRELVQNALDAGTDRVEVWTEFVAGDGHVGAIELHVDDYGEGMDEAIIDEQLTRLFSSTKENDLTKIGKFGIGFVSVFALKPKAVLVHTGRAGEYWEVLFHEDRTFTKTRLDVPVEGTQITIFIEGDFHEYRETAEGVRSTLKRWCSHSETEVTFEDRSPAAGRAPELETVNEPFEVGGDCPCRALHEGTEIALAFSHEPVYGFYNRGLTLALTDVGEQVFSEDRAQRYLRVAVKVKSRYLEHTLSRETVMRDDNYDKAMGLLDAARQGPLVDGLVASLEDLVARPTWGLGEMDRYASLCSYLVYEPEECLDGMRGRKILRGVHGEALRPEEVDDGYGRDGRIFLSEHPTDLTRRVREQGTPVLLGPAPAREGVSASRFYDRSHPLGEVHAVAARFVALRRSATLTGRVKGLLGRNIAAEVARGVADPEDVYLGVRLDDAVPDAARPLVDEARRLLRKVGGGYRQLRTFAPDASGTGAPFFVTGRKLSSLMARPPEGAVERKGKLEAAVNRRDPYFETLVGLWPRSPSLSAYCLAKCLLLADDRLLDRDLGMMKAALGTRR